MSDFGLLVLGPPGAGKSTLCAALARAARASGRGAFVVNLDPANEAPPYAAAVDVRDLIAAADAAAAFGLGPNGALLYAMDFLAANADWLAARAAPFFARGDLAIIDCPGQAELYTSHDALPAVLGALARGGARLAALHLLDAHHAADPAKFVAGALLALQAMVRLELPHINVLAKADQTEHFEGTREGARECAAGVRSARAGPGAAPPHPPPPLPQPTASTPSPTRSTCARCSRATSSTTRRRRRRLRPPPRARARARARRARRRPRRSSSRRPAAASPRRPPRCGASRRARPPFCASSSASTRRSRR